MPQSNNAVADTGDMLEINRVFDAPPALVFKMWSDVEHLVRWHGPEGMALKHCVQEFREGGAWQRCMTLGGANEHWISGVYKEIRPFERLSFTYVNEADQFEMLVEMDFRDLGGRTEMQFRQSPFLSRAERDGHGWGWNSSFNLFAAYVGQFAGIDGAPKGQPRIDGVAADIIAARRRLAKQGRKSGKRSGSSAKG